jgi:phosphate starvation-inducible PhoH-like protein
VTVELIRLEIAVPIEDPTRRGSLYGPTDRNLRLIRAAFDVRVSARDNTIRISGTSENVQRAAKVIESLQRSLRFRPELDESQIEDAILEASRDSAAADERPIDVFLPATSITPRGDGQREYIHGMREQDLTFCLGPAGTGKTYLAVAVSISLLKQQKIKRVVLVRPAVEAGEKLGYLPGDLQAKVNPYLRPLFDAMHDMMTFDQLKRFMQNDIIEVVPLAFMRGRTLNNAAIILDEAQNATVPQMLMFLTRLGNHAKMIVTGDDSQSDLARGEASGLIDAVRKLEGTPGISVVRLTQRDIVRHPLVQRIVEAYGRPVPGI